MKDFETWNSQKQYIDQYSRNPYYKEREIWWCSLGINIGVEVDGKNGKFERPVIILKYINKNMALIVPMTTKAHSERSQYRITRDGVVSYAKISQMKVISTKRFVRKMSTLSKEDFENIKQSCIAFFF